MSKMTLEQVRDFLREHANDPDYLRISDINMHKMADAIDAELKSRREPVGSLHVFRDEDGTLFRPEFINPDVLPVGDHVLYLAPPAPKIEITEEVLDRAEAVYDDIAGDKFADMSRYERPINGLNPYVCERDCLRAALEAALKETP